MSPTAPTDDARVWEQLIGPGPVRIDALRAVLDAATDPVGALRRAAVRLAAEPAAVRAPVGSVLVLEYARRAAGTEPLDPRIDPLVGLLSHRAPRHQELVYPRIPRERLGPIITRALDDRVDDDVNSIFAHWAIAALRYAPEATPAFLRYLVRHRMRERIVTGDCAKAFADACQADPRVAELGRDTVAAERPGRAAKALGPFVITATAQVATAADGRRLGAARVAQVIAAIRRVGRTRKVTTLAAALTVELRAGAPIDARLYVVSDPSGPRYDLWTFLGDTGVLFQHGKAATIAVAWNQGTFESARASLAPLAHALASATWREA